MERNLTILLKGDAWFRGLRSCLKTGERRLAER